MGNNHLKKSSIPKSSGNEKKKSFIDDDALNLISPTESNNDLKNIILSIAYIDNESTVFPYYILLS